MLGPAFSGINRTAIAQKYLRYPLARGQLIITLIQICGDLYILTHCCLLVLGLNNWAPIYHRFQRQDL